MPHTLYIWKRENGLKKVIRIHATNNLMRMSTTIFKDQNIGNIQAKHNIMYVMLDVVIFYL